MKAAARIPFCWQDKRVLRKIRKSFDDANTVLSALATYHALTEIASDGTAEEFQTTHRWIASMSGLSERTVRSRIADLQRIGVISVEVPALKAPGTYRLLPFGNGCPTSGNGCRAFGKREAPPLPSSEEQEEQKGTIRLTTTERISLERSITILKGRLKVAEEDTADQWQRDAYPGKVKERDRLRQKVSLAERRLLA